MIYPVTITNCHQIIKTLDACNNRYIRLCLNLKMNVPSVDMTAYLNITRIQLSFFDVNNEQIGDGKYAAYFMKWVNAYSWEEKTNCLEIPSGAEIIQVEAVSNFNKTITAELIVNEIEMFTDITLADKNTNFVKNSNFEFGTYQWFYGGNYEFLKQDGNCCHILAFHNTDPKWSFIWQHIDPQDSKKMKLSFYLKTENLIPGKNDEDNANVLIDCLDSDNKSLLDEPYLFGKLSNTTDWNYFDHSFDIPTGCKLVHLKCQITTCLGKAFFRDIVLEGVDAAGNSVNVNRYKKKKMKDYSQWMPIKSRTNIVENSVLDFSHLVQKPAGKHGFLKVHGSNFVFEDGTTARFIGFSIYGKDVFMSNQKAKNLAELLSRMGLNMLRLHHLDAYWSIPNIFDNSDTTLILSEKRLQQLDYLIYQLKINGIYIFFDLLVHRRYTKNDNVVDFENIPDGGKTVAHFNRRLIDLQKLYISQIFNRYNPYTKCIYKEEPAIALAEVTNESSIVNLSNWERSLPRVYLDELDALFNIWLKKKYLTESTFKISWANVEFDNAESYEDGTVKRALFNTMWQTGIINTEVDNKRSEDTLRFYYEQETEYFLEMYNYLRDIGIKFAITGSNMPSDINLELKANCHLDFIDNHSYWDHPLFWKQHEGIPWVYAPIKNSSILKGLTFNMLSELVNYRVLEKPFIASEWGIPFPNDYRMEGPLFLIAYGLFHGWNGLLQFAYNNHFCGELINQSFDISFCPSVVLQYQALALLFHRCDIKKAETIINIQVNDENTFMNNSKNKLVYDNPHLPHIHGIGKSFEPQGKQTDHEMVNLKYWDKENGIITSDTDEIIWNYQQGTFLIDTDLTVAVTGQINGNQITSKLCTFNIYNSEATIIVTSKDNVSMDKSDRIVITAVGKSENTDQELSNITGRLMDIGRLPVMMEIVRGSVMISRTVDSSRICCYTVDINGVRTRKIPVKIDSSVILIELIYDTVYYEIISE